MGAFAGFVLGYVVGARHGPEGYEKLLAAWQTVRDAPEVKALLERVPAGGAGSLLESGLELARTAVQRGLEIVAERAAPGRSID
jgi:hypothetical protein